MKKNTKTASKKATDSTVQPLCTIAEITDSFVAAQKKSADGANNYLADFLHVAKAVVENFEQRTFSFQDFVIYADHLETPREELQKFYDGWTKMLKAGGRLKTIDGCYSYEVHSFV